jgi:glyoxylase-like metal-dependent hydrolase (beta-lactamase superfamily II)
MELMEVAPGVHKVEGLRVGNAYVVLAPDGLICVDTGIRGNARHVLRLVDRLGHQPHEVRLIVLTHWHIDHVGSAAELKRLTGAHVAIHELDAPVLGGGELPRKGRRAMQLIVRLLGLRPLVADRKLHEGDAIAGFRVLHVPGHTDGSIALLRDDGVLLSGDALLGDRHGGLQPPEPGLSLDPARASESEARLRALPLTLVLPGHGKPARAEHAASGDG